MVKDTHDWVQWKMVILWFFFCIISQSWDSKNIDSQIPDLNTIFGHCNHVNRLKSREIKLYATDHCFDQIFIIFLNTSF